MNRLLYCLAAAGVLACGDNGGPKTSPKVLVRPVLDSLFVGDSDSVRTVIYVDAAGDTLPAGTVRWASSTPSVLHVDSVSGEITGLARGAAILTATANGVAGHALVLVADTLDLALVLDTIYLLPNDTVTIPVAVQRKGGSPPAPWFATANAAIDTVDSASGLVTSRATGTARYFVHAGALVDTGAIVVRPADTASVNSRSFFSVAGTANRHTGGLAYAINYNQHGGAPAFQLRAYTQSGNALLDNVLFSMVSALDTATTFVIDSISPTEAFGKNADPVCRPPRDWATWTTYSVSPSVTGLSRHTGQLVVTKVVSAPGGTALGGRFQFLAQRTDMYGDSLGAIAVRGTFVAPLYTNLTACP
ncbi:MAG TPA: hypothetical protein VI139_07200 [Gemmatimonadales bacterium]